MSYITCLLRCVRACSVVEHLRCVVIADHQQYSPVGGLRRGKQAQPAGSGMATSAAHHIQASSSCAMMILAMIATG